MHDRLVFKLLQSFSINLMEHLGQAEQNELFNFFEYLL